MWSPSRAGESGLDQPVDVVEDVHEDDGGHEPQVDLPLEFGFELQPLLHGHVEQELWRPEAPSDAAAGACLRWDLRRVSCGGLAVVVEHVCAAAAASTSIAVIRPVSEVFNLSD